MSKTIYHWHHIVPKHMGGTDDPSNLVRLTIEEHIQAHKDLYEKYGKKEDLWAIQFIGDHIPLNGELNPMYGKSAVKGRKWYHNEEGESFYVFPEDALPSYIPGRIHNIGDAIRKNRRSYAGENNPAYGREFSHTEKTKRKIGDTLRRVRYADK